jgi:hypothetical protein
LLERAGSREPADRGGVDGIGPRHIGLRLAELGGKLDAVLQILGTGKSGDIIDSGTALPRAEPTFFGRARGLAVGDLR